MAALPEVTAEDIVRDVLGGDDEVVELATELIRILEVESIAVTMRNHEQLTVVNHGTRLEELSQRIDAAGENDAIVTESYNFASMHLGLVRVPGQGSISIIGIMATGTLTEELTQRDGSSSEIATRPFELTFAVLPGVVDDRWFLVDVTTTER